MVNYKFCPQCANKLDLTKTYPCCANCDLTLYRNSKPCAGILPIKDGKVLLSKRGIEPFKGHFDIIGGFLEEGEHPKDGAIREAKEETGLTIKPTKLLGIYVDEYGKGGDKTLNIHYIGRVIKGNLKAKDDVSSLHWVEIDKVPTKEGFKNTQEAIKDLKKWYIKNKLAEYIK